MFRIDKSTISYKKNERPFVLAHTAVARPASLKPLEEIHAPKVEGESVKVEQEVKVELPDPAELLARARAEADSMLAAARSKAASLVAQATLEIEEQKNRAVKEGKELGYSQGYALGKGEGAAAYNAAVSDAQKLLTSAAGRIEEERAHLLINAEGQCVALAQDIAQKVVGAAFALDENAFPALIRKGLEEIQHGGRVTVRVSPLEYEIFFSEGAGWLSDETRTVTVVPDDGLKEGDLLLESEIESINAGVRAQFAAVKKTIAQMAGGA